jgi:cytochrome c oxidase subunit III
MTHHPTTTESPEHPPYLAHHFDTPQQQFASGKLGMWIFLCTEILMFGGLFCAYAVYRHNHPDVFRGAAQYLDTRLGAINTVFLIASSLTMAWGVRCAQLGKKLGLIVCLLLTLQGGVCFMGIKSIEYHAKWKHHLFPGVVNKYSPAFKGPVEEENPKSERDPAINRRDPRNSKQIQNPKSEFQNLPLAADPNAGTADAPKIRPVNAGPAGLAPQTLAVREHELSLDELPKRERHLASTFFSIYFLMTGLHGLHVLIGMGLITWILIRTLKNEFSPAYNAPVDLVGLYWHLVDLIWIFLFPLLYLIH